MTRNMDHGYARRFLLLLFCCWCWIYVGGGGPPAGQTSPCSRKVHHKSVELYGGINTFEMRRRSPFSPILQRSNQHCMCCCCCCTPIYNNMTNQTPPNDCNLKSMQCYAMLCLIMRRRGHQPAWCHSS